MDSGRAGIHFYHIKTFTTQVYRGTEELSGEDDKLRTEANDLSVDCQKVDNCLDSEGLSKLLEKLRDGLNFVFC